MTKKTFRIRVSGNKASEVTETEALLDELELTGLEAKDRLLIQEAIDKHNIRSTILYNGNTVWGKNRIVNEFKRLKKRGDLSTMTDHFYSFLHLVCGSIAHYSKCGWIDFYQNSVHALEEFFKNNEWGVDISEYQPRWRTDVQKIAQELLVLVS